MTALQILREVSAMLSQGIMESEGALRVSLNRALDEIGHLFPRKQFLTLRHFPKPSVFRLSMPREVKKESPLTVSVLSCGDIFFRGSGKGEVLISLDGKLIHRETLDGLPFVFDRTLSSLSTERGSELMMIFRSDTCFVLEELVLYEKTGMTSARCEGRYTVYRMEEEMPGFISLSGECRKNRLPMKTDDEEVILDGDRVWIDSDKCGVYEVGCYAAPMAVTEENERETIDLSVEVLHLVPLLCAYYACLEAEDERASAYLARYEEARDSYRMSVRVALNDTVEDVRGW